jgi:hypothetical protein
MQHASRKCVICTKFKLENLKGREHMEDLDIDEGIILKHILRV